MKTKKTQIREDLVCLSCRSPMRKREKRKNGSVVYCCCQCKKKITVFKDFFIRKRGRKKGTIVKKTKTCSIPGCDRPFYAKGLCKNHYAKMKRDKLKVQKKQQLETEVEKLKNEIEQLKLENYLLKHPEDKIKIEHGIDCICSFCQ